MAPLLSVSAMLLALILSVDAYWRMPCGLVQTGRIDAIVSPGGISSHVHKISGPPNFGPNSTFESLQNNRCTSCQVQKDKSAYWTPQLYYQQGNNGSFVEVPAGGHTVYYLGRGENASNIVPFPKGFQMLSGNPNWRSYKNTTFTFGGQAGVIYTGGHCRTGDGTCYGGTFVNRTGTRSDPAGPSFTGRPVADRVSFACLGGSGENPERPYMARFDCPNGLRAQIHFPSCWNGRDLYKSDQSHVAHPSQIDNGVCPPTHPLSLPNLFYEVLYGVGSIDTSDGGRFVFAHGDPTGYGFHGDFINGWDQDVQQAAVTQCINVDNGGVLSACAPFVDSLDENSGTNCPEQPAYWNETVHGVVGTKLPGCVNVVPGPADSTPSDNNCPPGTATPAANTAYNYGAGSPPSNPSIGSTSNNYTYLGCFKDDSSHSFSRASTSTSDMTNEQCQQFCRSKNMPIAATEYGKECYCGYGFNSTINLTSTCDNMICAGNSSQYCGGGLRLNAWNSTTYTGSYNPTLPPPGTDVGSGVKYLGCASEPSSGRALSSASTSGADMTNEKCAVFCASKGFSLFGTEWSRECYCGTALADGSTLGQSTCSMSCAGTASSTGPFALWANICGGSRMLTVWNNTQLWTPSSAIASSTASSTVSPSASPTATPNPYIYLGCASEASSGRALNVTSTSSSSMTNEACASYCSSQGLPLFGTEYSRECYCGNALATGSKLGQPESDCKMTCAGSVALNSTFGKYCGGGSRLTLWNNTAIRGTQNKKVAVAAGKTFTYTGCYAEGNAGRALKESSYAESKNMTVENCVAYCGGKGFKLAGTEYSSECFCGNTIVNGGSLASEWECSMRCSGDQGTWCGGSSRLSVYSVAS